MEGDFITVLRLLQAEADPNVVDMCGWTPLHWAARKGHVGMTKALMLGGATVEGRNKSHHSALDFALEETHHQVAAVLIEGAGGGSPVSWWQRLVNRIWCWLQCVIIRYLRGLQHDGAASEGGGEIIFE